jgi:hypothetical protein
VTGRLVVSHVTPQYILHSTQVAHYLVEHWNKEKGSSVTEADKLLAESFRQEAIEREKALKLRIIEEEYGVEEHYPYLTVLRFEKCFVQPSGKLSDPYEYAALKCENDKWYLTGSRVPQGLKWEDFILWLASGDPVRKLTSMIYPTD